MAMKSDSGSDLNAEINVTPMIDVMLVLLVIFIIAAPMMQTGVDIDLPKTETVVVIPDDPDGPLILSINVQRQVKLGKSATYVKWADLEKVLTANAKIQKDRALYIEGDKNLDYGVVVTAMAIARKAGVEKVMMLTDPAAQLPVEELDAPAR